MNVFKQTRSYDMIYIYKIFLRVSGEWELEHEGIFFFINTS